MQDITERLKNLKKSSVSLRSIEGKNKNRVLQNLLLKLKKYESQILSANQKDLFAYQNSPQYQKSFADRLMLNSRRLQQMVESLEEVIKAEDPVGKKVSAVKVLPNALQLEQVRSPLGLCFMIFESRPNVITEAFSLAFKAGNAVILKGGKESDETASLIYQMIEESLNEVLGSSQCFWGLVGASREITDFLMKQNKFIDVLIPRGGERLIEYVTQNSTLPLIKNDRGLCHIYVHAKAQIPMALDIIENAKTQRPGVCNAVETVLVDAAIANHFLPKLKERLQIKGVEIFACPSSKKIFSEDSLIRNASLESFDTEYLDLKINLKIVKNETEAIEHIEVHGSHHSEAIITDDIEIAEYFLKNIDAAVVYWNASTRFTDGFQFGLGGEIGISTQKLHVRGPVGLEALTTPRWIVRGHGQIRL